jgi:predicted ATPase
LRKILAALEAAVPQLRDLEVWRDKHGTPHLRGRYEHWRHNAGWQTEDQFSDGTLRLMGLLWALLDGHGPLLLEEPELSLHTEIVKRIPGIFASIQRSGSRQIVLSTHSADLLSDEGIAGEEVLVLRPSSEGTTVSLASADKQIRDLLEGGAPVADAVIPATAAEDLSQLALFGE